jgi:hypothetical protein
LLAQILWPVHVHCGNLPISAGRLAMAGLIGFSRMKNFCGGHS